MGFLRLFLALCVVQAHTGNFIPWPVPNGRQAVEMFFIISGFYMGLILEGRYRTLRGFYESRWLRIAVPYYFHFVFIVLISLASGLLFSKWLALDAYASQPLAHNGLAGISIAALANFTIFGQDWVMFLRDEAGEGLRFTAQFASHPDPLYRYLIIPQCWTVGLELCFYLMAPLLVKLRTTHLAALVAILLCTKLGAYRFIGLDHDPWNYRFFFFELPLFGLGILAWRACLAIQNRFGKISSLSVRWYWLLIPFVIAWGWLMPWARWRLGWHVGEPTAEMLLLLSGPFLIVGLFLAAKSNRFDRAIGELSYPIYLNHLILIVILRTIPGMEKVAPWFGMITGAASVLLAWLFWKYFLCEFERRRHRRFGVSANPAT